MTAPSPIRTIDGVALPAPGTWTLDPGHAEIGFVGRHFMLTKVRGRFTEVAATLVVADDPAASRIEATIAMGSVASGDEARDDHLRSADFFDVDNHPHAQFSSTAVQWDGQRGTIDGQLTIRGVNQPVSLNVTYLGHVRDPWGNDRIVFDASGTINRERWGLTWNMLLESGGVVVSKEIDIELHVEFVRSDERPM